jgi:hypothetical protein
MTSTTGSHGNIKRFRVVHVIYYAFLDVKSGTEALQKHPHPNINFRGGREGWFLLGVCVYVRKKSYSDTDAEELALTSTEIQGDASKGAEDEETAIMFKLEFHQKELDQCSIYMKRLIARKTFKTKTGSYEGFS